MGVDFTTEERIARSNELGIAVDPEYYYLLEMFTWTQVPTGHVFRSVRTSDGEKETVYLHHMINGIPPEGMMTDHKDRDPTNNRKSNLHNVNRCKNRQNSDRTDTAYCVYIRASSGLPYVIITRDNKRHNLGTFNTVEEAEAARDAWLDNYSKEDI